MRKQRRQAELQDKRDRIRMGLIPPDPPKGTWHNSGQHGVILTFLSSSLQLDESFDLRCGSRSHTSRGSCPPRSRYEEAYARKDERRAQAH